ncbi:hypothetical protein ACP70R_024149 [Stipagrostis hirtigluma subsp. patula]
MATGRLILDWSRHLSAAASAHPSTTTSPVSGDAHTSSTPARTATKGVRSECQLYIFTHAVDEAAAMLALSHVPYKFLTALRIFLAQLRQCTFIWRTTGAIAAELIRASFTEPGVAEEFSLANARYLMRQILCNRLTSEAAGGKKPEEADDDSPLAPWLAKADVDYFASEFERTGFTGGINYYRNMDRNW